MTAPIWDVLLWLFVVNLGIAFGAGLYEQRIVLPQWFDRSSQSGVRVDGEAMRRTNSGLRFWVYVTTVPLTLLTLLSLTIAGRHMTADMPGGLPPRRSFSSSGS